MDAVLLSRCRSSSAAGAKFESPPFCTDWLCPVSKSHERPLRCNLTKTAVPCSTKYHFSSVQRACCYVLDFGATRGVAVLVGYARTSTKEQEAGFEAQNGLQKHGCEKVFEEQVSSFAARRELDRPSSSCVMATRSW